MQVFAPSLLLAQTLWAAIRVHVSRASPAMEEVHALQVGLYFYFNITIFLSNINLQKLNGVVRVDCVSFNSQTESYLYPKSQ